MGNTTLKTRLIIRNDGLSFALKNPVLLKGEIAYDHTERRIKVGDGVTAWNKLNYLKNDVVISDEHPPISIEEDTYNLGTIWLDEFDSSKIYIKTSNSTDGNVLRWQALLTAYHVKDFGNMHTSLFAKETGAGKQTGYVDKALKANKLTSERNIALTGDVTGSAQFDGSANISITSTMKNSGVVAGAYTKVTVDTKGVVTAAENIAVSDLPAIPASKISGLGTAATKNTGTAAGNVPVLNNSGKLDENIIPAVAISEPFDASSQAAMLALTAQKGDLCIRADLNKTFCLGGNGDPKVLANWKELRTPTDAVLSVNGKVGAVTLATNDITEGGNNKYYTDSRVKAFMENEENIFIMDGGGA